MNDQLIYKNELSSAMEWLSKQPDTIFIGQAIEYEGTGLYDTMNLVPPERKMEFPIAENFQVGFSIGMALNGFIPVSIFPRWNFLLCAADQLVNHLDKMVSMSDMGYVPKVIIRVAVGSETPINPQDQHKGNFSESFRKMLQNTDVLELDSPDKILPSYKLAYTRTDRKNTILVEFSDYGK
jgi:pyruvate/2-oxoglutarate/acetoin dehydrogenase E1 component